MPPLAGTDFLRLIWQQARKECDAAAFEHLYEEGACVLRCYLQLLDVARQCHDTELAQAFVQEVALNCSNSNNLYLSQFIPSEKILNEKDRLQLETLAHGYALLCLYAVDWDAVLADEAEDDTTEPSDPDALLARFKSTVMYKYYIADLLPTLIEAGMNI